ncbi:MAG: DUF4340 domain-containing protein [Stellaceae bacterium]
MKTKGLITLLLVTAIAVILAVLVAYRGGANDTDPQVGKVVLPDMRQRLGEVARLTLIHGEAKTTLLRQGGQWIVEEKGNYPADQAKVTQAVRGLADLRYVEPKTRKADLYARLEVEDAGKKDAKSTLVTASEEKGTLLGEIIVGKRRVDQLGGGTDGIYARKPGDAQSWLASGTLELPGDTAPWLDPAIIDVPRDKVKEVVLIQPDGSKLDIAHDKAEEALALKGAPADTKLKSDTALVEPTTALASLTLSDVRPATDLPLPQADVSRAEVTTFDGLVVKLALVDKDGKSWARFEVSGTGEAEKPAQALDAKLRPWVFAIPDYKAKTLRTKLADVTAPPKSS